MATHQTITLDGREYVVVPRDEYEAMAGRTVAGIALPPLPPADESGNMPAVAFARVTMARTIIGRMNAVGVSQADLARESGVPAATLNRILKAIRTADESTITRLEVALGVREGGDAKPVIKRPTVKMSDIQKEKQREKLAASGRGFRNARRVL